MSKHETSKILCLGEVSWDRTWFLDRLPMGEFDCQLLSERQGPGGCALNTACILHGLRVPVTMAGNFLGDDLEGSRIISYLENLGIENHLKVYSDVKTPVCYCMVEKSTGRRSFIVSHQDIQCFDSGVIDDLALKTLDGQFSHMFVQPYISEMSLQFLKQVQNAKTWIMAQDLEPNHPCLPLVDCLQISLPEVISFDEKSAQGLAKEYFIGRMSQILLTAGGRGSVYVHRDGETIMTPAVKAPEVIDTTGCGDAFRAGFMASLIQGKSISDAMVFGSKMGAKKAGIAGSHFMPSIAEAVEKESVHRDL